jgi:DNA (cytosine-5)-methyltransferase 1
MTAYYNEFDPKAAAWLRELIRRELIAPGDVDQRSIEDVTPDDLRPYTQCHFFAGIGVWSYSLRLAGWPDDRPIWTGSCPCQPFSAAGKGGGFADERHLWPAMLHLIRERRPDIWLGEQVASKDGLTWFDLVRDDLEGEGYAVGAVDTSSALTGAPHIRQRLRIAAKRLADASMWRQPGGVWERGSPERAAIAIGGRGAAIGLADAECGAAKRHGHEVGGAASGVQGEAREQRVRLNSRNGEYTGGLADTHGRDASAERQQRGGQQRQQPQDGGASRLEHATGDGRIERRAEPSGRGLASGCGLGGVADLLGSRLEGHAGHGDDRDQPGRDAAEQARHAPARSCVGGAGPTDGFWRDADWLYCRDGKWRPVEPGTFPLAHGSPARVGRLRGYGNAVDAIATKAFIEAFDDLRLMSDLTTDEGVFG